MRKYYKERFEAQRRIAKRLASTMEVNEILQILRKEARRLVPRAMEVCILLLDKDAPRYTRPLQCALHDRPVNCLSCKRGRAAVQKALRKGRPVIISKTEPIRRPGGELVETGPEGAVPVRSGGVDLAVVSVVLEPGARFTRRDLFFTKDMAETAANVITHAKRHWEVTREKLEIGRRLAGMSPFVPRSVRRLVETDPAALEQEKQRREVTVLFLDLEDYTLLTSNRSEDEMNEVVEKLFSRFVDPIQRSGGEINETSGDGLMILFKDGEAEENAVNAVRSALDIKEQIPRLNQELPAGAEALRVNMGINSGTALLGLSRYRGLLETRMTYTATGAVTNLAARLADLAKGGQILVGEGTKRLVQGLWALRPHEPAELKGFDKPVPIWELVDGDAGREAGI